MCLTALNAVTSELACSLSSEVGPLVTSLDIAGIWFAGVFVPLTREDD